MRLLDPEDDGSMVCWNVRASLHTT